MAFPISPESSVNIVTPFRGVRLFSGFRDSAVVPLNYATAVVPCSNLWLGRWQVICPEKFCKALCKAVLLARHHSKCSCGAGIINLEGSQAFNCKHLSWHLMINCAINLKMLGAVLLGW